MENFQWKSSDEAIQTKIQNIKEEIADVMIYLLLLSENLNLNLEEEVMLKLEKNAKNYPVERSYGTKNKYTEL